MNDQFAHRAAEWDNPAKIEMTSIFANELKKNIQLNKDLKAFEIGAGTGLVGLRLLPELKSIVFEDTSEAMLNVLKEKLNSTAGVEIVHGEVTEYAQQDIDLFFSCMAFHHITDIAAALQHIYGISNSKAKIVVGDLITEDGSFHRFEPIPHKGFDLDNLSAIFEANGFKVIDAYIYNVLNRERTPGTISTYEQFILIAEKNQ